MRENERGKRETHTHTQGQRGRTGLGQMISDNCSTGRCFNPHKEAAIENEIQIANVRAIKSNTQASFERFSNKFTGKHSFFI